MTLEQHEPAVGGEQPGDDPGPPVEIVEPQQRTAAGVEQVSGPVELMRRVEHVGQDPAGRRTGRLGQPGRQLQHPRAEIDADDLVGAQVPQRERVPTGRALEVDRPTAPAPQVADQLDLGPEQVRPAAPDLRDRVGQPALVPLGGLVPGRPVGGVHQAWIGPLARRRRTDQGDVVGHPWSLRQPLAGEAAAERA